MTATAYEVIAEMRLRVTNVVPVSLAHTPFRPVADKDGLRAWIAENEGALRRFATENVLITTIGEASGGGEEFETAEVQLLVSYPHGTNYGPNGLESMLKVMDQDRWLIDTAIGHRSTAYTADAAQPVLQDQAPEELDDVTLMVLTYEIGPYWRNSA